jgi:hypothetical protein
MIRVGTVRGRRVGARVWVRRRDRILNAQDEDAPELVSERAMTSMSAPKHGINDGLLLTSLSTMPIP